MGTTPGLDALEKKEISGRLTEIEGDARWNTWVEGQIYIWNN